MSVNVLGDDTFIEIRHEDTPTLPRLVEVYVAQVEPQRCRTLLKVLSRDLPLGNTKEAKLFDLSHLKRVKKSMDDPQKSPSKKKQKQEEDTSSESTRKKKAAPLLEVLLRDVESLEGDNGTRELMQQYNGSSILDYLKTKYEEAL